MGCECSQQADEAGSEVVNEKKSVSTSGVKPSFTNGEVVAAAHDDRRVSLRPSSRVSKASSVNPNADILFNINDGTDALTVVKRQTPAANEKRSIDKRPTSGTDLLSFVTVQVGNDLFCVQSQLSECIWLRNGTKRQDAAAPSDLQGAVVDFTLSNLAATYVVLVGGESQPDANSKEVLSATCRYDIASNEWQALPDMNVARKGAASCTLDGAVFVFCGFGADTMPLNSIEVLVDAASNRDLIESWKLIYVPEAILTPRWLPAVAPLNESEIAIIGGCSIEDDEVDCLGDVIVFNVETEEAEKVVKNYAGLL